MKLLEAQSKDLPCSGLNNVINIHVMDNHSINFIQHYNDDNPIIQLKKPGAAQQWSELQVTSHYITLTILCMHKCNLECRKHN